MLIELAEDRDRLVAQLSPPMSVQAAGRALGRIFRAYARQLGREDLRSCAPADEALGELAAVHKALVRLGPRAVDALQAAALREPRARQARFRNIRVARYLMKLVAERAMAEMPRRSSRLAVGPASLQACHLLCVVYCRAHQARYPTWDHNRDRLRSRRPITFAFRALRAWHAPGPWGDRPWTARPQYRSLSEWDTSRYQPVISSLSRASSRRKKGREVVSG